MLTILDEFLAQVLLASNIRSIRHKRTQKDLNSVLIPWFFSVIFSFSVQNTIATEAS